MGDPLVHVLPESAFNIIIIFVKIMFVLSLSKSGLQCRDFKIELMYIFYIKE